MFNILDRYIAKSMFKSIFLVFFILVGLSAIIKFIEQLRRLQGDYDFYNAFIYTIFLLPKDLEIFFPISALIGSLVGLGILASKSELVAIESAGFSRLRIGLSVMKIAIPLVLVSMLVSEFVAPAGEKFARELRAQKMYGTSFLVSQNGIWLKEERSFVYVNRTNLNGELFGISIYDFDANFDLEKVLRAEKGKFNENKKEWELSNISEINFKNKQKIERKQIVKMNWKSNLMPNELTMLAILPDALSIRELNQYIHYLKQTGQDLTRYQSLFWGKIFKPFSVAVMMLLALSFVFGPLRSTSLGLKILMGIAFGFLFYIIDNVFSSVSVVYRFPAILGAILPSILFLILSFYLLQKKR